LTVSGLPAGYYVKQARYSGTDALGDTIVVSGTESGPLEIVIGEK
jgi:hypothetical protein